MSATMARQGGQVLLEQSDMRRALNMAKMAKGGFSRAAIEETQFQIKKPRAKVRKKKKCGVEFPGHTYVTAVMERHPAMLREHQTDGFLPFHNGTAPNPQTRCRRNGTGAPPPERLGQPTPEPTTHPPEMPLPPPGNNEAPHISEMEGVPPRSVYIHTPLPSAQFFNLDAYSKDHKCDKDFNPDLLTDEWTSTGLYAICYVVMQLISIFQTTPDNWADLTVKMSNDSMKWNIWVYYYLQLVDILMYLLMDIFICITKEQSIDKGESTWRWYKGCQNTINDISAQIDW